MSRRRRRAGCGVFLAACLVAGGVHAVEIAHDGNAVFHDTFANQDVDGTPPVTADIHPGGNGESWVTGGTTPQVLDENTNPPGTLPGSRYGAFLTNNDFTIANPAGIYTTGSLTVRFALHVGAGGSASGDRFRVWFGDGAALDINGGIEWDFADDSLETWGGTKSGLSFQRDTWQDYTITYHLNTADGGADDSLDITVDGIAASGLPADGPKLGNPIVDVMFYRVNGGTDTYLHAFPAPGDIPRGIPIETGTPVQVTKVFPEDCRLVRGFTHAPVDGRIDTRHAAGGIAEWVDINGVPAVKYREFHAGNGLHVTLPAGGFDALQVRGDWLGRVYTNWASLTEPGTGVVALCEITHGFPGVPFPQRVSDTRLSFFYDAGVSGPLADVTFLRIDPGPFPPPGSNDLAYSLGPPTTPPAAIDAALVDRFGPGYTAHDLQSGGGTNISLAADEFLHLLSPELDSDWGIEAVRLDLDISAIPDDALLTVRLQDVLDPRREVMGADLQVAGPGLYTIRLDAPDQVFLPPEIEWANPPRLETPIAPPPVFWLSLSADEAMDLQGIDVTLHRTDYTNALAEAGDRRMFLLKGLFSNMSEPRPWMNLVNGPSIRGQISSNPTISIYETSLIELLENAELARVLLPGDDIARQYQQWLYQNVDKNNPLPPPDLPVDPGAPTWALQLRETWRSLAQTANWWLDNRMVDGGLLGGGVQDDTDMFQTWQSLPWIESEPLGRRLKEAAAALADSALEHTLEGGINKMTRDALHAYEDGVNQLALNAWWFHGDPVHFERTMTSARSVTQLMIETPDLRRHFGNGDLGIEQATNGFTTIDRTDFYTWLFLHPLYEVGKYNRHPAALAAFEQWGQTWSGYQSSTQFVGQVEILPGTFTQTCAFPCGPVNEFLALFQATGDDTWLDVIRLGIGNPTYWGFNAPRGRTPHALVEWGAPYQGMMEGHFSSGYAGFFLNQQRSLLDQWLNDSASWYGRFGHMHTAAEQKTDRVFTFRASTPISCYIGDAPNRNDWVGLPAVSYENLRGEDFAALVWDAGTNRLRVAIFNFTTQPLSGVMRVWRLDHGMYQVRAGPDANDDGTMDNVDEDQVRELQRFSPIALSLPPRQVTVVQADSVQPLGDVRGRADLALSPLDLSVLPDGSAEVGVHNIGVLPASNVTVFLERYGLPVQTQTVAWIDAPLDLLPRSVTVVFPAVQDGDVAAVDPLGQIPEITEHNNRLTIAGGSPADPGGDLDGDTACNVCEYVFGLDPNDPSDGHLASVALPVTPVSGAVEVSFRRWTDYLDRGLTYLVEGSPALEPATWSVLSVTHLGAVALGGGIEQVTLGVAIPAAPDPDRYYLRLRVASSQ